MTFELLTIGIDREFNDYYIYFVYLRGRALFSLHYLGQHQDQETHLFPSTVTFDLFWLHLKEEL